MKRHCRKSKRAVRLIARDRLDQDCPQHPRINQRCELQRRLQREREKKENGKGEGKTGTRRDTAVARVHVRDGEKFETAERSYSWLASVHHHSRAGAFVPSMNKQPVLLLFRALFFVAPSLPLCLSVCLFLVPFRLSRFSVSHSLSSVLALGQKERTIFINLRQDDPVQFPRRDLRNSSRRRETHAGGKKELSAMGKHAIYDSLVIRETFHED